jgi:hypothetical protein
MKKILLASVGALALCAAFTTTASAGVSGTLGGSYANDSSNTPNLDMWNIDGSLTWSSPTWGAEVAGGYHSISPGSLDIWNVGGSVFWNWPSVGRLAGTVNYDDFGSSAIKFTSYGAGLDWFAGPNFTVDVKGGGTNIDLGCSGCSANGGYVGGMLKYYALGGNLALSGSVDYFSVTGANETDETLRVEYLWKPSFPMSIYGGYQHQDGNLLFGGTSQDIFFVGLKFYFNGGTAASLEDRQRNGSLGYISKNTLFWNQY